MTLDVGAGVAQDAAGNLNKAAAQVSIAYINEAFVRTRTQRVVSNYISLRADQITANTPDIFDRLSNRGSTGGGAPVDFTTNGTLDSLMLSFATSLRQIAGSTAINKTTRIGGLNNLQELDLQSLTSDLRNGLEENGLDIWIKGNLSHINSETIGNDLGQLYIGLDYRVSETYLWGVLAQFDWSNNDDTVQEISTDGTGWFAGPYIVARVYDNVIFDGLVSYGQSDNDVTAAGANGSFDTNRFFIKGQLTGDFDVDRWHIEPHAALIYFEEEQKAFTNSLNILIPGQTIDLGRVTLGPKISTQFTAGEGMMISPYIGLIGIWDFNRAEIVDLTTGLTAGSNGFRGRVEGGVEVHLANGWNLSGEGYYDGIGADNFDAYGGSVRIKVPLN